MPVLDHGSSAILQPVGLSGITEGKMSFQTFTDFDRARITMHICLELRFCAVHHYSAFCNIMDMHYPKGKGVLETI